MLFQKAIKMDNEEATIQLLTQAINQLAQIQATIAEIAKEMKEANAHLTIIETNTLI